MSPSPRLGQGPFLQRHGDGTGESAAEDHLVAERALGVATQPGRSLDRSTRADMEGRFARDFSGVRVHTDERASESATFVNALAYTFGRHVVFRRGSYAPDTSSGRRLLAHELTHVVQQRQAPPSTPGIVPSDTTTEREASRVSAEVEATPGGPVQVRERPTANVQRYEAGEHAQMGETQQELGEHFAAKGHIVKKGETIDDIAKQYGVSVDDLKAANQKLLKTQKRKGKRSESSFSPGDLIVIPQKKNELATSMLADPSAKFTVNGVQLDYGTGIAMGDLYENPEDMAKAPAAELKELSDLVQKEKSGTPVPPDKWQKATKGRFLKLASQNEAHFAPSDPKFVSVAPGAAGPNHKTEWEKHHKNALDTSKAGDKDTALLRNSFADHFLTDAFAAGHLLNKRDLMEQFKGQLKLEKGKKEFDAASKAFFDTIAKAAFTGSVQKEFSKYETVEKHYGFHPNIDSAGRFSTLLQGIHQQEPVLLASAVAKGVHDKLNTVPGGLSVVNNRGDAWALSGDNTLNAKTLAIARKAVAQSQLNIITAFKNAGTIDYAAQFQKVWDYTPRPAKSAEAQVKGAADAGTDINNSELQTAIVTLINANYLLIISELVTRKILQKA